MIILLSISALAWIVSILDKDAIEGTEYFRKEKIDFVFDADPDSIAMWRRRGIFVFDVNQSEKEF